MISLRANNWVFKTTMLSLIAVAFLLLTLLKARAFYNLDDNIFVYIYSVVLVVFVLSRIMGAGLYSRSKNSLFKGGVQDDNYEPTVSIVIPCKNEEGAIANTIEKCFQAEYPKDKLEVIVINDGSTDNTLAEIQRMQVKYPELIVVNWPVNRGKKEAMAVGFRRAKGELVAQMDSDSYFTPETFRNLVLPFKVPEIAAVCAHADPANADTNWLTKMQAAYYFESFRILKAAESVFMTVFCCSGCSSCYRKSVVMPLLDTWLKESFLGKPVTWGDDRSLTNLIIKSGYKTVYTDEVQAYTIVPETWGKFLKQQVRWKKSWSATSVDVSRYIWKRDPFVAFTYFFPLLLLTLVTPFVAAAAMFYEPIVHGTVPWDYLTGVLLITVITTAYYRMTARDNRYWPYMIFWAGTNMIFLSYVLFYSIATIQDRGWGTR